ncbi:MAG: hypothetical protein C4287_15770, partial [Leptolyngbya sp. ERB_1_2]
MISPDSVCSIECKRELEYAIEHHKKLIAVVCRDVEDNQVHPALAALNWIFMRSQDDFNQSFHKLLQVFDTDLDYVQAHTRLLIQA